MDEPMIYPEGAGWKGTDTSKEAALKVEPRRIPLRRKVWDMLETPQTGYAIAEALGANLYSVLPRISEMQRGGMVRDSGKRGETKLGNDAVIWERVPTASYTDAIDNKTEPRIIIKDWQVEMIRDALAHLSISMDGHALAAEKKLKDFLLTL